MFCGSYVTVRITYMYAHCLLNYYLLDDNNVLHFKCIGVKELFLLIHTLNNVLPLSVARVMKELTRIDLYK